MAFVIVRDKNELIFPKAFTSARAKTFTKIKKRDLDFSKPRCENLLAINNGDRRRCRRIHDDHRRRHRRPCALRGAWRH